MSVGDIFLIEQLDRYSARSCALNNVVFSWPISFYNVGEDGIIRQKRFSYEIFLALLCRMEKGYYYLLDDNVYWNILGLLNVTVHDLYFDYIMLKRENSSCNLRNGRCIYLLNIWALNTNVFWNQEIKERIVGNLNIDPEKGPGFDLIMFNLLLYSISTI